MKPKLPRKTILLSLILIAIAVVNVLAERYLTSSKDAEDPEKRE